MRVDSVSASPRFAEQGALINLWIEGAASRLGPATFNVRNNPGDDPNGVPYETTCTSTPVTTAESVSMVFNSSLG